MVTFPGSKILTEKNSSTMTFLKLMYPLVSRHGNPERHRFSLFGMAERGPEWWCLVGLVSVSALHSLDPLMELDLIRRDHVGLDF